MPFWHPWQVDRQELNGPRKILRSTWSAIDQESIGYIATYNSEESRSVRGKERSFVGTEMRCNGVSQPFVVKGILMLPRWHTIASRAPAAAPWRADGQAITGTYLKADRIG